MTHTDLLAHALIQFQGKPHWVAHTITDQVVWLKDAQTGERVFANYGELGMSIAEVLSHITVEVNGQVRFLKPGVLSTYHVLVVDQIGATVAPTLTVNMELAAIKDLRFLSVAEVQAILDLKAERAA